MQKIIGIFLAFIMSVVLCGGCAKKEVAYGVPAQKPVNTIDEKKVIYARKKCENITEYSFLIPVGNKEEFRKRIEETNGVSLVIYIERLKFEIIRGPLSADKVDENIVATLTEYFGRSLVLQKVSQQE